MASARSPICRISESLREVKRVLPAGELDHPRGKALLQRQPPTEFLAPQVFWWAGMDDPASFEPCPDFEGTLAAAGSGPGKCFALPTVAASS